VKNFNSKVVMVLMGELRFDGRVKKEIHSLEKYGYEVEIITMPKASEGKIDDLDVKRHEIVLRTREVIHGKIGVLIKFIEFTFRTIYRIIKTKPDVIHAHDLPALLPSYIAKIYTNAPLIYDSHELYTEQGSTFSDNIFWKKLEKFLLQKCDGVIAANESRADVMFTEYGSPHRPVAIYNCPQLLTNNHISGHNLLHEFIGDEKQKNKIILYTGIISEHRHYEDMIIAAKYLKQNIKIVILGYSSPEYLDELKKIVIEYEVGDKIFFHPSVPHSQIISYSQSADLGIVFYQNSSRNNYLCAPNKLFDFLMVGVPVLFNDLAGIREIADMAEIGKMVNPTDPQEIAQAANEILSDEDYYKQLQTNACALAKDGYNWETQELKLLELYKNLNLGY
jgi:glycosyltransferase involved in cell wall biosynthesis